MKQIVALLALPIVAARAGLISGARGPVRTRKTDRLWMFIVLSAACGVGTAGEESISLDNLGISVGLIHQVSDSWIVFDVPEEEADLNGDPELCTCQQIVSPDGKGAIDWIITSPACFRI